MSSKVNHDELNDVFWTVWSDSEVGSSTWSQDKKNYNNADNYRILQKLSLGLN